MYSLVAIGFTLILGVLDKLNFAHQEVFMLGGFAGVVIAPFASLWWSYPLAIALGGALGQLTEFVAFRRFTSQDAKIAAFMPKIEIAPDPALASYFPAVYPARVEAKLKNGETASVLVTDALGDPARPLSDGELLAKFHRLTDPVIGAGAAESLAKAALGALSDDASLATLLAAVEKTKALG